MKAPILGQTGSAEFDEVSYELTQNWYPHVDEGAKNAVTLLPTPGELLFASVGVGEIRGLIKYDGALYVVSNNGFYSVSASGISVLKGTLNTSTGVCILEHNGANNGQQICITDGTNGYIYNSQYDTFSQIRQYSSGTSSATTANKLVDATADFIADGVKAGTVIYNTTNSTQATVTAVDSLTTLSISSDIFTTGQAYEVGTSSFPDGATHVAFMDGFFIFNDPSNSGRFYISASYDGTDIDGLDFATAERSPDELLSIIVSNRILWLVGADTAEAWFNSGGADFPFEPIQSGYSQVGTPAKYSVIDIDGSVFWLTSNEQGQGMVAMTHGMQPKIISNTNIAAEINKLSDITDARAWSYQRNQQSFYVLTFPHSMRTFVHDMTTSLWHEMSSKNLGYHRSTAHVFCYGKHLVGDPINGKIYELRWDVFTDNGDTITRIRRSRHIHNADRSVRHYALQIEMKEGVGNSAVPDPQLLMRFRDNNGAWSNEKSRSMGKVGETNKKIIFRRLGRSRDRVYELKVTDAVEAVLVDAFAHIGLDSRVIG